LASPPQVCPSEAVPHSAWFGRWKVSCARIDPGVGEGRGVIVTVGEGDGVTVGEGEGVGDGVTVGVGVGGGEPVTRPRPKRVLVALGVPFVQSISTTCRVFWRAVRVVTTLSVLVDTTFPVSPTYT